MKKALVAVLIAILLSCLVAPACYANSAEPPSIVIIVTNAPKDLAISIVPQNIKANRTDRAFESYYTFYSYELQSVSDYTFNVATGDKAFDIKIAAPLQRYNNLFTLDLANQTVTPGKSLLRTLNLVSLRLILTLLIEGVLFYLFGYRKKRSWIIFLAVNLVTQGLLNLGLNSAAANPLYSYLIFNLIGMEILVFFAELIVLLALIREHSRVRTGLYVMGANIFSLVLGGYLIMVLPV